MYSSVQMQLESWISPKTAKGLPSKIHGKGFFASANIQKGEVVAVKLGHAVNQEALTQLGRVTEGSELQISDNMYLVPLDSSEVVSLMVYCNHSCEPNLGWAGNILSVAMRDINAGEELTIDHATHLSDPSYKMTCNCGSATCRKTIKGNDWQIPELQAKYTGYFSWYIDQKIKALTS